MFAELERNEGQCGRQRNLMLRASYDVDASLFPVCRS